MDNCLLFKQSGDPKTGHLKTEQPKTDLSGNQTYSCLVINCFGIQMFGAWIFSKTKHFRAKKCCINVSSDLYQDCSELCAIF